MRVLHETRHHSSMPVFASSYRKNVRPLPLVFLALPSVAPLFFHPSTPFCPRLTKFLRDVQTLHNILSTVEATLSTVVTTLKDQSTSNTPSSSNPIPSGSSSSTSGAPRQNAHASSSYDPQPSSPSGARMLAVAPNGASVVVNLEETAGLWVSDLEAELGREGPRFDLRPADRSYKAARESTPRSESGIRPATARDLLHRNIGIAVARFAEASTSTSGLDPYADLVPELLSQFPSEAAWEHMMRKF